MAEESLDIEGNVSQGITDSHSWRGVKGSSRMTSTTTYGSDGETKRKLEDKGGGEEEEDGGGGPEQAQEAGIKKQKITIGFSRSFSMAKPILEKKGCPMPISIKLGSQKPKETPPSLTKASASVAEIFNQDSDEEEMPPEARMRMRNIGRDTPTSAGPNSFGKTRQGFCDVKKVFERNLKKQMDDANKN